MGEMKTWAEREIDLAIQHEEENCEGGDCMYGVHCYESALKAFNSPLTPIEDTEDMWEHVHDRKDGTKTYQCRRMTSFFKDVHPDGTVKYRYIDPEPHLFLIWLVNWLVNMP